MRRAFSSALLLAGILLGATVARGQTFDISWYKIAGGGGTSSGGNFTVTGTIGQPDAGNLSGGNFSITGGFWGIIAAVQTPGSPTLVITPAGGNQVKVSWVSTPVFRLQSNPAVANKNGWNAINTNSFPIQISNGTNSVTLPVSGNQFFRLITP